MQRDVLIELVAEAITSDSEYKYNIMQELNTYNDGRLINAVCEYTELTYDKVIKFYS